MWYDPSIRLERVRYPINKIASFFAGALLSLGLMNVPAIASAQTTSTDSANTPIVHPWTPVLDRIKIHHWKKVHASPKLVTKVLPNIGEFYSRGIASYEGMEGSRTSTGVPFRNAFHMCAMRYLPFHSIVTVKNINNGRTSWCEVLDRGPFVGGRIIDLAGVVIAELSMGGTAPVEIYVRRYGKYGKS